MSVTTVLPPAVETALAESATGCYGDAVLGQLYGDRGVLLTAEEAKAAIRAGKSIASPSAGAGSYRRVFSALGFDEVRPVETSSSAGDWFLAVRDEATGCWHPAWQSNRYPHHGFSYSVEAGNLFASFDELVALSCVL